MLIKSHTVSEYCISVTLRDVNFRRPIQFRILPKVDIKNPNALLVRKIDNVGVRSVVPRSFSVGGLGKRSGERLCAVRVSRLNS